MLSLPDLGLNHLRHSEAKLLQLGEVAERWGATAGI